MLLSPGLYAITDQTLCASTPRLLEKVKQAIAGGAVAVQYRNKLAPPAEKEAQAQQLALLCRELSVPLIINDDPTLAQRIRAQGVHLGKDDISIAEARKILGHEIIIGVSCYNELWRAERAVEQGADYIAFGSFFPSGTKPQAVRADRSILVQAKKQFPAIPLVAIGGITPQNASLLIDAGADLVAVIQALFEPNDSQAAAQAFTRLFKATHYFGGDVY